MRFAVVLLAALLWAGPALAVPTAGRVAYWMGEGNALDSWGLWDMVSVNGSGYAPGLNGQAFSFDGIDDYVTLGPVTLSPFRQDIGISYSFWANIPTGGGGYAIGAEGLLGDGYGGVAYNLVPGSFGLDWSPTSPTGDTSFSGSFSFTPDAWHHVAVTADFASNTVTLYLDGQPVAIDFMSNVPSDYTPDASFTPAGGEDTVGARIIDGVVTAPFRGLLDDVMLYERALSPAEVTEIYVDQGLVPEPGSGLLLLLGLTALAAASRRP